MSWADQQIDPARSTPDQDHDQPAHHRQRVHGFRLRSPSSTDDLAAPGTLSACLAALARFGGLGQSLGGDVALKKAARQGPRRYQVSVLEVVDENTPDETIEQIESQWKNKLLSRRFGLNRN